MQDDRDDKDFIPKLKITKIKPTKASTPKKDDTDSSTDNDDKTTITHVKKEPLNEESCYRYTYFLALRLSSNPTCSFPCGFWLFFRVRLILTHFTNLCD